MTTFVALGDSLTEGVGDPHPDYPNGWRGWAKLVADALGTHTEDAAYVNLALRGRRVAQVLEHQVPVVVRARPSLATVWAGGNDLLLPRVDVDVVAATLDAVVAAVAAPSTRVVVLTVPEVTVTPLLRRARPRVVAYNDRVRALAERRGATLVDVADLGRWGPDAFCVDRVHLNAWGHRLVAHRVADALGVGPVRGSRREAAPGHRPTAPRWAEEARWWTGAVVPHVWRWGTMAGRRDRREPKWAEPVPCVGRLAGREAASGLTP
ncbi:SGNH/GDSL hydrolase family protein [Phycicoccus sp. BSK3Z-2]|uniref:SGNH/GDSL hydrolase family protein n=1 Tax=Phycicoccus avicenniae TaxID=2828860 RepID=A0A941D9U9_9MICO|nr:SGNH/GDSL hydrolase family protein [Phycicoccus avicenniae]MBR7744628.1 SGNH/GDSL hydrolase family protein [Phycicoccus avicenniae]